MTIPRFLVSADALTGTSAVLTGPELHHLRVRRLRVGNELVLSNGLGQERHGIVVALDRHQALIRLTAQPSPERESPLRLVLAQALLKADKLDLVIEKATELGVNEMLVFTSQRTMSRAFVDRQPRWNRIARSAAKQSQRSTVPPILGPISFERLLSHHHTDAQRLFFWEESAVGGLRAAGEGLGRDRTVVAVVGPEGGFSPTEAEQAAGAGFRLIGLAGRILRAETAAIVAVTLCQFLWGDLAGPEGSAPT